MSVEVGIWKVADGGRDVRRVAFGALPDEAVLEEALLHDIGIIDSQLLLIGRQVHTDHGGFIDLLAMDPDGRLVVIELKRDRTPREVVAQALDYGSWVRTLGDEQIASIFDSFNAKQNPSRRFQSLDEAFQQRFDVIEMPESLNDAHELVVVAGELDPSTERIVNYLTDEYGVSINVVFFRFFRDGDAQYLSRAWLIAPQEVEDKAVRKRADREWNGEFYVSFGESPDRRWEDARRYGYIAGGGGSWYSNTLKGLEPGNRIWVNVPGKGYVGVGIVQEAAVPTTEFKIDTPEGRKPIHVALTNVPSPDVPQEELEYYVRVEWLQSRPLPEAIREKGFFGNQNTVARPKDSKWVHTVERLKIRFGLPE